MTTAQQDAVEQAKRDERESPPLKRVESIDDADPANPPPSLIFEEIQRRFPREFEIAALSVSNRLYAQAAQNAEEDDDE